MGLQGRQLNGIALEIEAGRIKAEYPMEANEGIANSELRNVKIAPLGRFESFLMLKAPRIGRLGEACLGCDCYVYGNIVTVVYAVGDIGIGTNGQLASHGRVLVDLEYHRPGRRT